jgi:hypothetical protein
VAKPKSNSQNGLKIIADTTELFSSLDPKEIGKLDYLICATKTYDIETSLESIKIVLLQTRYSYLYIMNAGTNTKFFS